MEVTVGAAWRGEAAISRTEEVHSLFKWLISIVVQDLYCGQLHSWCLRSGTSMDSLRDLDMRGNATKR